MIISTVLNKEHLSMFYETADEKEYLPVRGIFDALTQYLHPPAPVFFALSAMVSAYRNSDFGIFHDFKIVWLPLKILGMDHARYQTPIMEDLRKSMLSVRSSDLTMQVLDFNLQQYGMKVLFLWDGIILGAKRSVRAFSGSTEHIRREKVCSTLETAAQVTRFVSCLSNIQVPTIDLHPNGAEKRLFASIEQKLSKCSCIKPISYTDWVDRELTASLESIPNVLPLSN